MEVYIIYHCNEWKECSSFKFIGVVEESALEDALHKIQDETGYNNEDMETYIYLEQVELNELSI